MPPGSFELFEAGSTSKNEKTKQNKFSNVFIHNPQVLSSAFIFTLSGILTEGMRLGNGKASI